MIDPWFRWEREAAIHLIFPTLEGSMKPLEKITGNGFPITILGFKNGIVTWYLKNSEFYSLGAKLLKIYKDEINEQEMLDEIAKRLIALERVEKEIDDVSLTGLTDEQLAVLYNRLHEAFINFYGVGAIQEPLAMQAEIELKEISGLNHDEITHLVIPNKLSFIQEADNYLLKTKDIERFVKKYYWLDNNYSRAKVLSGKEVSDRLKQIKSTKRLNRDHKDNNLNSEARRLIKLLKNFATYQDERKRNILIYLHYLEVLLKEVSKRANISLEAIRETFPHEIKDILDKKITEEFIIERREKCFVVWEEGKENPVVLTGKNAKKWEKILTPQINISQVIKGNCASKGKAIGKVRILLNASENDKLQDGEVLVTFMTSPDFMSAIRRCAAIVTNLGGITSHAAIISRELRIPCIVGTKIATQILKDGDLVEVNANNGLVKKLS